MEFTESDVSCDVMESNSDSDEAPLVTPKRAKVAGNNAGAGAKTTSAQATYQGIRMELKAVGIKNGFKGATVATLLRVKALHLAGKVPLRLYTVEARANALQMRNHALLSRLSLKALAQLLPQNAWNAFVTKGWLQHDLHLPYGARRLAALVTRVTLAEHGVCISDASAFERFGVKAGNDRTHGWLRNPAFSAMQYYLCTHPKVYKCAVGLYARSLLRLGKADTVDNIRACIELTVQVYNSKLHLPESTTNSIEHLDVDWRRPNCDIPAPQFIVATSPSKVDHTPIYKYSFVNCDTEERHELMKSESSMEAPKAPYIMPRTAAASSAQYGGATHCPAFVDFSDSAMASSPDEVDFGHLVAFGHKTAHQFTQHGFH